MTPGFDALSWNSRCLFPLPRPSPPTCVLQFPLYRYRPRAVVCKITSSLLYRLDVEAYRFYLGPGALSTLGIRNGPPCVTSTYRGATRRVAFYPLFRSHEHPEAGSGISGPLLPTRLPFVPMLSDVFPISCPVQVRRPVASVDRERRDHFV